MVNKINLKPGLLISISLLTLFCTTTSAKIIYVDADAKGLNNGTSWPNAYTHLQSALLDAASGNQIWVAEGVYKLWRLEHLVEPKPV